MTKIEAKYFSFPQRFFISSGLIYVLIIILFLEAVLLLDGKFDVNGILLISIGFLLLLLLWIIKAYHESKLYLKEVKIDKTSISLKIIQFDKVLPEVVVPLDKIQLSLNKDFIARYKRYRLEIRIKKSENNPNNKLIHNQYQIGYWKKNEFKKIIQLIQDTKDN